MNLRRKFTIPLQIGKGNGYKRMSSKKGYLKHTTTSFNRAKRANEAMDIELGSTASGTTLSEGNPMCLKGSTPATGESLLNHASIIEDKAKRPRKASTNSRDQSQPVQSPVMPVDLVHSSPPPTGRYGIAMVAYKQGRQARMRELGKWLEDRGYERFKPTIYYRNHTYDGVIADLTTIRELFPWTTDHNLGSAAAISIACANF